MEKKKNYLWNGYLLSICIKFNNYKKVGNCTEEIDLKIQKCVQNLKSKRKWIYYKKI